MEKGLDRSKRDADKLGINHTDEDLKITNGEKRTDLREIVENICKILRWFGYRFEGLVESWWIPLIFLPRNNPA